MVRFPVVASFNFLDLPDVSVSVGIEKGKILFARELLNYQIRKLIMKIIETPSKLNMSSIKQDICQYYCFGINRIFFFCAFLLVTLYLFFLVK